MSRPKESIAPKAAETDPVTTARSGDTRVAEERHHRPEPSVIEDGLRVLYG